MRPKLWWQSYLPLHPYVCSLLEMTYNPVMWKSDGTVLPLKLKAFSTPRCFLLLKTVPCTPRSPLTCLTRYDTVCGAFMFSLLLFPRGAVMFWTTERYCIAHRTTKNGRGFCRASLSRLECPRLFQGMKSHSYSLCSGFPGTVQCYRAQGLRKQTAWDLRFPSSGKSISTKRGTRSVLEPTWVVMRIQLDDIFQTLRIGLTCK